MYRVLLVLGVLTLFYLAFQGNSASQSGLVSVSSNDNFRPVQQGNVLEDGAEAELEFSWLNQDVSQGNPISWSGKPNATAPFRPGQNSLCHQLQRQSSQLKGSSKRPAELVVQGHTVPLAHELYSSRQEEHSIVPYARMRSSLACCPSSLHSDQGCVCGF